MTLNFVYRTQCYFGWNENCKDYVCCRWLEVVFKYLRFLLDKIERQGCLGHLVRFMEIQIPSKKAPFTYLLQCKSFLKFGPSTYLLQCHKICSIFICNICLLQKVLAFFSQWKISLTLSCLTSGTGSRHHVTMPISQQCGHCWHGDHHVNYVLGT